MTDACTRRELGLVAAACFILRLPALISSRWFDPDEAAIAVQARTIVAGGRLYVDMADRKPPIPPFVYAFWFDLTSSSDPRGPRLIASALLAVAAVVLTREVCRTHGRRAALWTAVVYVVGSFALSPVDAAAANYAHFALPLATLALVACQRGGTRTLLGGLLLGFAILSRQSWIFAIPAGAASCWLSTRTRGVAFYAVGLSIGVATAALMAPWSDFWFWNFQSSPGFVFAAIGLGTALGRGAMALLLFLIRHLALAAGALSTLPGSLRTRPDLWLWTGTALAASSAGFRFYGHYWLQAIPPLALLAGPALSEWSPRPRRLAAWSLAVTAAVSVVSMCIPEVFRERRDAEPLAATIRACTAGTDRVFVWGSFPELAVAVDRPTAGTLVHSDFVSGRSGGRSTSTDAATPGAQDRMMRDLIADPPAVLVDTSGVDDLSYGAFPMLNNAELASFAQERYQPSTTSDGFVLWFLDPPSCEAASELLSRATPYHQLLRSARPVPAPAL